MTIDRKALASCIRELHDLSADEKSALLELLNSRKKYGLVWEDKPEKVEDELLEKIPLLKEVTKRHILSNDSDAPNHILIEGDNLHALTVLQYTHAGKIDVIYIDPPYNRGKNDFKYNDSYIDREHAWRHSLWSGFIYKRLSIAKHLLSPHGVIIVHIDENEFCPLHLIMDEIFREQNRLGTIIWNKKNPKGDPKEVSTMHESIYVYAKNKEEFNKVEGTLLRKKPNAQAMLAKAKRLYAKNGKSQVPDEIKQVIKPFNFPPKIIDEFKVDYDLEMINKEYQNWLSRQDFSEGELAYKYIDANGNVYRPVSMAWPNKEEAPKEYWIPLIHPITRKKCPVPSRGWRNPPNTMNRLQEAGLILFGVDHTTQPQRKYILEENLFENVPSIYDFAGSDDDLLADLKVEFEYPKPVETAKYLLNCVLPQAKTILDFFAGSGTALHAAMSLNSEDGGTRTCILVTNNENEICEQVTYKRSQQVIQGYTNAKGEAVLGLTKNNLRYYQVGFVERAPSMKNRKELTHCAVDLLCIRENCYEPLKVTTKDILVFGKKSFNHETREKEDDKVLVVILEPRKIDLAVSMIKKLPGHFKVYVFSPGHYAFDDEFEEVAEKIELCALPEAILQAYNKVLPKAKRKFIAELEKGALEE